jgi:hypothetical protein
LVVTLGDKLPSWPFLVDATVKLLLEKDEGAVRSTHPLPEQGITMTPLRQRMIDDMEVRSLSPNMQHSYLQQVSGLAKYCHRSPEEVGPDEICAYQVRLTT